MTKETKSISWISLTYYIFYSHTHTHTHTQPPPLSLSLSLSQFLFVYFWINFSFFLSFHFFLLSSSANILSFFLFPYFFFFFFSFVFISSLIFFLSLFFFLSAFSSFLPRSFFFLSFFLSFFLAFFFFLLFFSLFLLSLSFFLFFFTAISFSLRFVRSFPLFFSILSRVVFLFTFSHFLFPLFPSPFLSLYPPSLSHSDSYSLSLLPRINSSPSVKEFKNAFFKPEILNSLVFKVKKRNYFLSLTDDDGHGVWGRAVDALGVTTEDKERIVMMPAWFHGWVRLENTQPQINISWTPSGLNLKIDSNNVAERGHVINILGVVWV